MIKRFLCTVQDLGQVSGLGIELIQHLLVEHLVRVGKVFSVGTRHQWQGQAAHQAFNTAEECLADFRTLIVVKIE